MKTKKKQFIWIMVPMLFSLMTIEAWANRTVYGRITDPSGKGVANLLVRAWDSDEGSDDFMGDAYTNSNGDYSIRYRDGHWDPAPHGITKWRPDIYITVMVRVGNDWVRTAKSKIHSDHPLRDDLRINEGVPSATPIHRLTEFRPEWHSLPIDNDKFKVCAAPTCKGEHVGSIFREILQFEWALCGGFSLTALRDFRNGRKPPEWSPATKERVIENQMNTLLPGKWLKFIEWQAKPTLPPDSIHEIFNPHTIGYSTEGEWPKVRQAIDAGAPIILGLIRVQSTNPNKASNNHQVLAYGYTFNDLTKQVTVYVYDPNYHAQASQIRFNIGIPNNQIRASQILPSGETRSLRGFFVITDGSGPPKTAIYQPSTTPGTARPAALLATTLVRRDISEAEPIVYRTVPAAGSKEQDLEQGAKIEIVDPEEASFYEESVKSWTSAEDEKRAEARLKEIYAELEKIKAESKIGTRGGDFELDAKAQERMLKVIFPQSP
ncbi:MAG: hypothetical protein JXA73_22230 [Acidobacteria bacterium]|nr:hypothetical protein [Acidobacteriota bacterium]